MSTASRTCAVAVAFALVNCVAAVHAAKTGTDLKSVPRIELQPIGTYDAGTAGSAEIVSYDAASKRLFLVNAATATVDILDVQNPTSPTLIATIDRIVVHRCEEQPDP